MHSLFIGISVDNVLLQTLTSHKQCCINSLLHNTANVVKWTVIRAVKSYISGVMKITDVCPLFQLTLHLFCFLGCCRNSCWVS